jgi:hypothetical protein
MVSIALREFINRNCPRKDNFCDGTGIKDRTHKVEDLGKCQYHDDIVGCTHPSHPRMVAIHGKLIKSGKGANSEYQG